MGMGMNGIAVASHSIMILILVLLAVRSLRSFDGRTIFGAVADHGLTLAIGIMCGGLAIERSYYIAARVLRDSGVNLWEMHPAPEILSLIASAAFYSLMVPFVLSRAPNHATGIKRVLLEVLALFAFWATAAALLF